MNKQTCPRCGAPLDGTPVQALTPDSPELKQLFDGTLNRVTCPACQAVVSLDGGHLAFRDAAKQYILLLMPEPEDGSHEQLENEVDARMTEEAVEQGIPRPTLRLVYSRPDFLEKISLHRLGFDDRLVEYAKLQLFRNLEEPQLSRSQHRLLLDYSGTDDQKLMFIVYDRESQRPLHSIQVDMREYLSLEEELMRSEELQRELEAAFPGCYVSADRLL